MSKFKTLQREYELNHALLLTCKSLLCSLQYDYTVWLIVCHSIIAFVKALSLHVHVLWKYLAHGQFCAISFLQTSLCLSRRSLVDSQSGVSHWLFGAFRFRFRCHLSSVSTHAHHVHQHDHVGDGTNEWFRWLTGDFQAYFAWPRNSGLACPSQ